MSRLYIQIFASLILAAAGPLAAAPANAQSIAWKLRDGSERKGSFVRLEDEQLFILEDKKEKILERDWLTPQSLKLAKELEDRATASLVKIIARMDFTGIKAKTFEMGAPRKNLALQEYEPNHPVNITRSFLIKQTEVTWDEWNSVRELARTHKYTDIGVGNNGYQGDESGNHPVTNITWWDAVKWCNLLSQIEHKRPVYYSTTSFNIHSVFRTKNGEIYADPQADGFRLPTEAEWELAWQQSDGELHASGKFPEPDGWHRFNSLGNTHPVRTMESATSKPLHDMLGNVAEWCWDRKGPLWGRKLVKDPAGAEKGEFRVYRGGSWADDPFCCRPTYRGDFSPVVAKSRFIGFRPVRTVPAQAR